MSFESFRPKTNSAENEKKPSSFDVTTEVRPDNLEYVKIVPEESLEKKIYPLETGESIEVTAREFFAPHTETGEQKRFDNDIVFLPGWKMDADSAAVESLGKAFAERSKGKSFAITTRTEGTPNEDHLYKEALAVSTFIKEKGLKNIVLAGHSQGGDKAMYLATILQQDPELRINGLVLLDSVGLYEQTPGSLARNFAEDGFVNTPLTMTKNLTTNTEAVKQGLRAGNSVVAGIFREVAKSGAASLKRMKGEVEVMAQKNSRMDQVQVPVILMSGAEDTVSHPEKIIPPGEEERVVAEWEKKDAEAGTDTYIDPREKYLQETMFPNSPYIRMVTPEKLGHHGLPLFRSASVANASLYLLQRFERRNQ